MPNLKMNAKRAGMSSGGADRLSDLGDFGANPGALGARAYVPAGLKRGAPLVVVLHGCTQTAAGYDRGAGWSAVADAHGFALLFPEQRRENNANLCFNWFERADMARGGGEPESIAAMVGAMVARHGIDRSRVFVTGLSAGGAMAAVMLATWPELFAGGAIVAGLPYGVAEGVPGALGAMRTPTAAGADALAARVRAASAHTGPWPRVAIWQGEADRTVAPGNADALARQWTGVLGLRAAPDRVEAVAGHTRRVWLGADGRAAVEEWRVGGMGHGTPVGEGVGAAGAFMLDVGLSSTRRIAAFWGIAPEVAAHAEPARADDQRPRPRARRLTPEPLPAARKPAGVGRVIEDALRKAGLMR